MTPISRAHRINSTPCSPSLIGTLRICRLRPMKPPMKRGQSRWYTHTVAPPIDAQGRSHFWNRTLDYLFTNTGFVGDAGEVLQRPGHGAAFTASGQGIEADPMLLSDHAPVMVKWSLPKRRAWTILASLALSAGAQAGDPQLINPVGTAALLKAGQWETGLIEADPNRPARGA